MRLPAPTPGADLVGSLGSMSRVQFPQHSIALGATMIGALSLIVSCWSAPPLLDKVLTTLEANNLSLVETGTFGGIRSLSLSNPLFKTRKLNDHSYLMGVSSLGDRLLMNVHSNRTSNQPEMADEVDITGLDGTILTRIEPSIRGMLSFCAELSPDGQAIAFGGHFARLNARGVYGLHLLTISGEIRTLVATTEAQTPLAIGWSPNSRTIVYELSDQVLMYHLESNTSTVLTEGSKPTWSPNGSWIGYRTPSGGASACST